MPLVFTRRTAIGKQVAPSDRGQHAWNLIEAREGRSRPVGWSARQRRKSRMERRIVPGGNNVLALPLPFRLGVYGPDDACMTADDFDAGDCGADWPKVRI